MSYGRESVFVNKGSYLSGNGWWRQIVDFVLIEGKKEDSYLAVSETENGNNMDSKEKSKYITNSNTLSSIKANSNTKSTIQNLAASKKREYWLYVIHNCNSTQGQL